MQAAAASDPACAPNVITYSALMTACCAGGRPDKAYEVFQVRILALPVLACIATSNFCSLYHNANRRRCVQIPSNGEQDLGMHIQVHLVDLLFMVQ